MAIDNNIGNVADTAMRVVAVTPNDSADMTYVARMLYVGTGGNVCLVDTSGNETTHKNVPSGSYLGPFKMARVKATNTTAADILAYV